MKEFFKKVWEFIKKYWSKILNIALVIGGIIITIIFLFSKKKDEYYIDPNKIPENRNERIGEKDSKGWVQQKVEVLKPEDIKPEDIPKGLTKNDIEHTIEIDVNINKQKINSTDDSKIEIVKFKKTDKKLKNLKSKGKVKYD